MKVAIIGCGKISDIYFGNAKYFSNLDLVACADLNFDLAKQKAEEHNCEARSLDEVYLANDIELIINLTIPQAHYQVSRKALENDKHVYSEKPFTLSSREARELMTFAASRGLRIGSAPDTFLGTTHQLARQIVESGRIGKISNAYAFMMARGHEAWHPAPEFYYLKGGGPLWDMGPYYISALVNILGPVKSVFAMSNCALTERTCTTEARNGDLIPVEVDTHYTITLNFKMGAIVNLVCSFDSENLEFPNIVLNGTKGAMKIPDPNYFTGDIEVCTWRGDFETVEALKDFEGNGRGLGVSDMIRGIEQGEDFCCNEELICHIIEVMESCDISSSEGSLIKLNSASEINEFKGMI